MQDRFWDRWGIGSYEAQEKAFERSKWLGVPHVLLYVGIGAYLLYKMCFQLEILHAEPVVLGGYRELDTNSGRFFKMNTRNLCFLAYHLVYRLWVHMTGYHINNGARLRLNFFVLSSRIAFIFSTKDIYLGVLKSTV